MSFIYKLDSRAKLFFILLFTILVFLVDKLPIAVCLLIFFIIIRLTARIPLRQTAFNIKIYINLTLLAAIIILMQTIFGPGESYIVKSLFSLPVKPDGFILGLIIVCRLASLLIILPVFTETTPFNKIASGFCALGFNYRSAFIITTAFNLIPIFKEEAFVIMDAQKLRGVRKTGIKTYAGILVPLMLGAMRKAQNSSIAMDSRAFGIYNTRTWIEKPCMKTYDYIFMVSCIVFTSCFLFFNYF